MSRFTVSASATVALALCLAGHAGAGPVRGAVNVTRTVQGFRALVFKTGFHPGQPAVVVVHGDGDTNLDLYVYDSQRRLVAKDTGPTDRCRVSWTPQGDEPYTIRVVNRGGVPNRFRLRTN